MAPLFWAAEVGLALLAFFAALLCYGAGNLLKAISRGLGHPSIFGLFTIPLDKWFDAVAVPVENFFIGLGQHLGYYIEYIIRNIASVLVGVFNWFKDAIANHASQIEYLHNHGIPASARAAVNTADAHAAYALQLVRTEIHAAEATWANHHTYVDAQRYIALERSAPSVQHAFLAAQATTLIATEIHAQQLHDQLRAYIGHAITGQADVALPYQGATLRDLHGAITIPRYNPATLPWNVEDVATGAVTAVGTAVAVIAGEFVRCAVRNCEGNNNFANLLKDALGLASLVGVADFLTDAINHPAAVEKRYATYLEGVVKPLVAPGTNIISEIEALLGV